MPQSFLADKSVPVRWRVWAVINGFFIAGKEFWASNEWIAEQIGCHKDSVSQGVKELEELGMMHSKRTRRSRVIYPGNGEIGTDAYLRPNTAPISDRPERLSISDSISGKEYSVAIAPRFSGEGEDTPAPKKEKDENLDKCVKYWRKKCVEETGLTPATGIPTIRKKLKEAHVHLSWPQIKEKINEWFENDLEDHEKIQITRCFSAVQIDKFKAENV